MSVAPAHAAGTEVETEARRIFEDLVRFETVAGNSAVQPMAEYLRDLFLAAGFAKSSIEIVPAGDSVGMIVRYAGHGSTGKAPVLFLAHMDVVGVEATGWSVDPWEVTEKDEALYGRGTVDNKYGVLTISQAFLRLKREGFMPDRDLVIAFTGDEETQAATTRAIAQRLAGAAFAVNADAGGGYTAPDGSMSYAWQAAEKTYATFELTALNRGGHSSAPRPDNAIYELANALTKIAAYRFPVRWNEFTLANFAAMAPAIPGELGQAVNAFVANPGDPTAVAVLEREPGIDRDLRTTCVATMLQAGTAENALATTAMATVNCRIFPGEGVAEVRETLARLVADDEVTVRLKEEAVEGPVSSAPNEALEALGAVLATRAPGATVTPYMEAGGTDGRFFRQEGIPTLGMGPLFSTDGSNYNFHGNDERLPLGEFSGGLDHFYLFIKALAGFN